MQTKSPSESYLNASDAYSKGFDYYYATQMAPRFLIDLNSISLNDFEEENKIYFIKGLMDAACQSSNNPISSPWDKHNNQELKIVIKLSNISLLQEIKEFIKIPSVIKNYNYLTWTHCNAFEFLGLLAKHPMIGLEWRDIYNAWSFFFKTTKKGLSTNSILFNWCKTDPRAVAPSKSRISDSGYDVTIIDVAKKINDMTSLYSTGIKVEMIAHGWYLDLVPRSSIIKTGYILANMIGVIDRGYTGEILVALTKLNPEVPDLTLPNKIAQLIPRPIVHGEIVEVKSVNETDRSDGGFGSTDAKKGN